MSPKELNGENLGDKHRVYNEILRGQIVTQQINRDLSEETDVNNLLKIDVASHNKDVDFILKVLQSNDILYVSRALAKCIWLIADQDYANIINPNYLQTELFPKMNTKAIIKFKKHIRNHIKDEPRAEMFYLNEKDKNEAIKWLPHCSVAFVEKNIENHNINSYSNMKSRLFKRLCEKSVTIFEIIIKELCYYERNRRLQATTFFLNTDMDKYLLAVENKSCWSEGPKLNHKATKLIMRNSPSRVIDKIENYISMIHIPTFVNYLKVDEIKPFLYSQAKKDDKIFESSDLKTLFYFRNLQHFIKRLPKDEQFHFVTKSCMLKENKVDSNQDSDALSMKKKCERFNEQHYIWYRFAPFDLAFEEITKLITSETNGREKRDLFSLLTECADHNLQNTQIILKYFINKHKNEKASVTLEFVTNILKQLNIVKCDENTWQLLNEILTTAKIYETSSELSSSHTQIINFIIIYNIINDQNTPEVIVKLSLCNTLKPYRAFMNQEQQNKVFTYFYEYLLSQLKTSITKEDVFTQSVETLKNILILIKDFDKSLLEYPEILHKIRAIITLKRANLWKVSLASLYNVNKSWRKHMFEESLDLSPDEEVCLNALKHEPQLLKRHKDEVEALRTNSKISIHRLLRKLRIYWPHTIAQEWIDAYFNHIKEANYQNVVVQNLCIMLPQKQLLDIIEKYKPTSPKIDWKQIDESIINVQRALAKNMYRSRPQLTPDAILPYATGDYLQFALPSLVAIFYNLQSQAMQKYILKLLNAPVAVQKHGIRIAFEKLDREQAMKIFLDCWQTSKNLSIRAIIFKYTFTLLCSEKEPINAVKLWEFLKQFIDKLTHAENKDIYIMLSKVGEVPLNVRAQFLQKSYEFFKTLIPKLEENDRTEYQMYCAELATYTSVVMKTIESSFVTTLIEEFIENDFFKEGTGNPIYEFNGMIGVISTFILCSQNEEDQIQKYKKFVEPLLQKSLTNWNNVHKGEYFIKDRFRQLLNRLSNDLKDYVVKENMVIPFKIYSLIQNELENSLSLPENYLLLTNWKLDVAVAKLLKQHSPVGDKWDEKIAREIGATCLELLKKDVTTHFPCIYLLFSICLKSIINHMTEVASSEVYDAILSDNFIQGYLTVIEIEAKSYRDNEKIWQRVLAHPSVEVKMHYYCKKEKPI